MSAMRLLCRILRCFGALYWLWPAMSPTSWPS